MILLMVTQPYTVHLVEPVLKCLDVPPPIHSMYSFVPPPLGSVLSEINQIKKLTVSFEASLPQYPTGTNARWPWCQKFVTVGDEVKFNFCVVVDNKPATWDVGSLFRYLRDKFYEAAVSEGVQPPILADVVSFPEKNTAVVCMGDERSVSRIIQTPFLELPSESASGVLSAVQTSALQFRQYVPNTMKDESVERKAELDKIPGLSEFSGQWAGTCKDAPPVWAIGHLRYSKELAQAFPSTGAFDGLDPVWWPEGQSIDQVHGSLLSRLCVKVEGLAPSWDECTLIGHLSRNLWILEQEFGFIAPSIITCKMAGDHAILACGDEISAKRLLLLTVLYVHPDWQKAKPAQFMSNQPYYVQQDPQRALALMPDAQEQTDFVVFSAFIPPVESYYRITIPPKVTLEIANDPVWTWSCDLTIDKVNQHLHNCLRDNTDIEEAAKVVLLKKRLCLIVTNKPTSWSADVTLLYIQESLRIAGLPVPHIANVQVQTPTSVVVAFHDMHARDMLLRVGVIALPLTWMCQNRKSSLFGFLVVKPWMYTGDPIDCPVDSPPTFQRVPAVWPDKAQLADVTDFSLRCRLVVLLLNTPIGLTEAQLSSALACHLSKTSEVDVVPGTLASHGIVTAACFNGYALVACATERQRAALCLGQHYIPVATEAGSSVMELIPVCVDTDWPRMKALAEKTFDLGDILPDSDYTIEEAWTEVSKDEQKSTTATEAAATNWQSLWQDSSNLATNDTYNAGAMAAFTTGGQAFDPQGYTLDKSETIFSNPAAQTALFAQWMTAIGDSAVASVDQDQNPFQVPDSGSKAQADSRYGHSFRPQKVDPMSSINEAYQKHRATVSTPTVADGGVNPVSDTSRSGFFGTAKPVASLLADSLGPTGVQSAVRSVRDHLEKRLYSNSTRPDARNDRRSPPRVLDRYAGSRYEKRYGDQATDRRRSPRPVDRDRRRRSRSR